MKYKILILVFLINACSNKEYISDRRLFDILHTNFEKYSQTKEEKFLTIAFDSLKKNKKFNQGIFPKSSGQWIIPILFNLKKYKKLEELLQNDKNLNNYYKTNTIKLVKYLRLKNKNKEKAKTYMKESVKMINDSLLKFPNDSLKYFDLFFVKRILYGKEIALKQIDSMESKNKFSSRFSKMLKRDILEFPIEMFD